MTLLQIRAWPPLRDLVFLLGLLGLALIPRLALLHSKAFGILHSDHAVFGLMAKHILEGKPMVYYYGQGYMGSLEAFMTALIFLIRGMDILSVQLAPLCFYLGFLVVNFFLVKRIFGIEVSVIANLLLAVSPPGLSLLSVTALGGYPETLFFGSLTLLGLIRSKESKQKPLILFLTGLAAGVGFWTNNLILTYFIGIALFVLLKSRLWKKFWNSFGWRELLFLQSVKIPRFLRFLVFWVHVGILTFLLWHLLSFFLGDPLSLGGLKIKLASPPFHIKKVKKIFYLLLAEIAVLFLFSQGVRKAWDRLRPSLPLAAGFLGGASPVFLYSLLGGEGYRVIHGSGAIFAKDLPLQLKLLLVQDLAGGVLGIRLETVWGWGVLSLAIGLLGSFVFFYRNELVKLFRLRPFGYSYAVFPPILTIVVLGICLLSTLKAGRYLIPLYFSFSLFFALALAKIKLKNKIVFTLSLILLITHAAYGNVRLIQNIPNQDTLKQAHESILGLLSERGIKGAYAHYVTSYVLTLQSQEKIIVAPYRSHDRYPPYTDYVNQLEQVAYLFQETDAFVEVFERALDLNRISYEKVWIDPFWVFLIDRRGRTEKGRV